VPDRTKVPPGRRKSRWRIREVTSKIVGGGSGRRYREGNAIGKSADIGTLHATATTSEVCVTVAQSCESEAQGVQSQFGCWNVLPLQGCVACKEVAPRCLLVRSMALHHSPLRGTRLYASEDNQFNGHSGVKIQRTPLLADLRDARGGGRPSVSRNFSRMACSCALPERRQKALAALELWGTSLAR
jgi:hypothetical protein